MNYWKILLIIIVGCLIGGAIYKWKDGPVQEFRYHVHTGEQLQFQTSSMCDGLLVILIIVLSLAYM